MALFAIGDLHLSLGSDKPMDVFHGWEGYMRKLEDSWRAHVGDEDTVLLAGDTSWAMKLENCGQDFAFIHSLPGKMKLMIKGNHDYWWSTRSKMDAYLTENIFSSLGFIHNDAFIVEGKALCGTRGWMLEGGSAPDQKVMDREVGRLRASLEYAQKQDAAAEKIVFLHYPPVYPSGQFDAMLDLMLEYNVRQCYYGHLHGGAIRYAAQGDWNGIRLQLISADAVKFSPVKIVF